MYVSRRRRHGGGGEGDMDSTGLPVELGRREGEIPSTESWPARGDRNSRDRMMGGGGEKEGWGDTPPIRVCVAPSRLVIGCRDPPSTTPPSTPSLSICVCSYWFSACISLSVTWSIYLSVISVYSYIDFGLLSFLSPCFYPLFHPKLWLSNFQFPFGIMM